MSLRILYKKGEIGTDKDQNVVVSPQKRTGPEKDQNVIVIYF